MEWTKCGNAEENNLETREERIKLKRMPRHYIAFCKFRVKAHITEKHAIFIIVCAPCADKFS